MPLPYGGLGIINSNKQYIYKSYNCVNITFYACERQTVENLLDMEARVWNKEKPEEISPPVTLHH